MTIPHPEGCHVTIPARRTPQYIRQLGEGSSSLARSCNPTERTCILQGCFLEVNLGSFKYWDPKEEMGTPKEEHMKIN